MMKRHLSGGTEMKNLTQHVKARATGFAYSLSRAIYPPQCLTCDTLVEEEGALCATCWPQTPFIFGLCCDSCGTPLPGVASAGPAHCDECLTLARPWEQGRAAMLYGDKARHILLGLKYHDRLDYVGPAGRWMARIAAPIIQPNTLVAPIPLHWLRLLKRRYNQSAILSHALARNLGLDHCPDLLIRTRHTGTQDGRGRAGRFGNVEGAFAPHRRQGHRLKGRHILLVDDVMTVGATFSAASDTCLAHGAASVRVVALARVARSEC
jgi:predicted amidophosphoribosyltransferase